MEAGSNYSDVTKCGKSRFNSIKREMFEASQRLGIGTSRSVPYDTAWVARVPKVNERSPAFPRTLEWLRSHQLKDGSWEAETPNTPHGKILNTFVAVLALSEWNNSDDEDRIKRGVQALELMAKTLPLTETNDHVYELLISSLLDDARELKVGIPFKDFEFHSVIGKEILKRMEQEIMTNKPNDTWTLLESAGGMDLELAFYRPEITRTGLIASQPATTAFILRYARLRGEDFLEAEWALEKLCEKYSGGVPRFSLCDNFEIIYGLDFLLKADINPRLNSKYASIQKSIDTLIQRYDLSNGVGFSSNWPATDNECSVVACRVLSQFLNGNPLLNIYDATTNASCLTKTANLSNARNVSLYYNMLQQVFEIKKDTSEVQVKIIDCIGKSQNFDGGWGGETRSSAEETAYVCLVIYRLIQSKCDVINKINFHKLVEFMGGVVSSESHESFWYCKVNFSSSVLTEVVIACAKHVVFQIQRLHAFSEALDISGIEFLGVNYADENDKLVYLELLPLMRPGEERQKVEVDKTELVEVFKSILGAEHVDERLLKVIDYALDLNYKFKNYKTSFEVRVIDLVHMVGVFLVDEYFDTFLEGKKRIEDARSTIKIACEILRGDCKDVNTLPDFNFWGLPLFWKLWSYCRNVFEEKKWDAGPYVTVMEKTGYYKNYLRNHKVESYCDVEPTSKQHLFFHKHDTGLVDSAQFYLLSDGHSVYFTEFENDELFLKFRDSAAKATRMMFDIFSIHRDVNQRSSDNYGVRLMKEYKISADEAMRRATKKGNKEILKMYYLKNIILQNPKYKGNEKMALALEYMERFVHAIMLWSTSTPRYEVGSRPRKSIKKVRPERKDVGFIWELGFNLGERLTQT